MTALLHRKRKVDANQAEIVRVLEKLGCHVVDMSSTGKGMPDLAVSHPNREFCMVEVKNKAGKNRFTDAQLAIFPLIRCPIYVFYSINDAIDWVKGLKTPINWRKTGQSSPETPINARKTQTKKATAQHR